MPTPYDDIIRLPHHVSRNHPQMPLRDRAAQFAPFAALTGCEAAAEETARLTGERRDLDTQAAEVNTSADSTGMGFGKRQSNVFFKTVDDGGKKIVLLPFPVRMESEPVEFHFHLSGMNRIIRMQLIPGFQNLSQRHLLGKPFIGTLYSPAHETLLRTREETQSVKLLARIIQFLLQNFVHIHLSFSFYSLREALLIQRKASSSLRR